MIKSIYSTGPFLQVNGGNPGTPYINPTGGGAGVGNMRYNPNSQNIEVYDGYTWIIMSSYTAQIGLSSDAVELLEWARQKRTEEAKIKALADKHPGIKDLKEKLDIMVALVKDYDETR